MTGKSETRGGKRGTKPGDAARDDSPELYRKDALGTLLQMYGEVQFEQEIVQRRHADVLFRPTLQRRRREDLGLLGRMAGLGECIIELYSETPPPHKGYECLDTHLGLHTQIGNHARRNRKRPPRLRNLWIISPGRPLGLIRTLAMSRMGGWPPGFWRMHGELRAHLVVVRDLPPTRDTLFLRILGNKKVLARALRELNELPERSRARRLLTQVLLAWRDKIIETMEEEDNDDMLLAETKARFAELKNQVYTEGVKDGLTKGLTKGRMEGERTLFLKMLGLRFGPVPAAAERRVKRASIDSLERWAEQLLTAKTLTDVFRR